MGKLTEKQKMTGNVMMTEKLTNLTHIIKLAHGSEVAGVVLGPDDKPFPGAKVKAGRRWEADTTREATSGSDGRFRLLNVKGQVQGVTATADGYNPATKAVTPGTNVIELTLKLTQGASLKGVVLDPEGQPVSGVQITYGPQMPNSAWIEQNNLVWTGTTDEQGRFEWKSAPADESEFDVHKEGFARRRDVKLKPGEEDNIIRLTRPRKVLGVVGDVKTGQPVAKFFVWPALGDENGFRSWSESEKHEYADAEGHFALDIDDETKNIIQVGADDYVSRYVVLPAPQDGYVTVTVLLEANPTEDGTVVDAAGQPVPDVQVGVAGRDWKSGLQIAPGRLVTMGNRQNVTRTDQEGHFRPQGVADPQRLIAISTTGYGEATWAGFLQTRTIVLQPFGRIEGTIYVKGKPAEGQSLTLDLIPFGRNQVTAAFQIESDKDGKFAFGQVPPGERDVIRLVQTAPNSWQHAHRTPVTVRPSETTLVNLGNVGATITGRLNSTRVMAGQTNVSFWGMINTPYPKPPTELKAPADYRAWSELPETVAAFRQMQNYLILLQPDGTFSIDGVAPGAYTFNFNAETTTPTGNQREQLQLSVLPQTVNVGEEAANAVVPMDVGELTLLPAGTGK